MLNSKTGKTDLQWQKSKQALPWRGGGGEQELTEKSMRELSSNRKTAYVLIGMSYVGLFSC